MSSRPDLDAEDEATWPPQLLKLLNDARDVLRAFEAERREIDARAVTDVSLRVHRPENSLTSRREELLGHCGGLLSGTTLRAFHCTNLHHDEVDDVRCNGLDLLSAELASRRIAARVTAGTFSQGVANRLLEKSAASHEYRTGRLWFVFSRSTLREHYGVYRLLDYWGGEAIYGEHEHDPKISTILKGIGRPAIVEASIALADIDPYPPVVERLIAGFMRRRGLEPEHDHEFEEALKTRLPGERVRRVITPDDADFWVLTGRRRQDAGKSR